MDRLSTLPYTVRACTGADYPAILRLLKITVGETESSLKTERFWRWKHVQNPFGESYSVCAETEGDTGSELAGLRTLMWWELRTPDGELIRAVRPVDTATHPDHQRKGIFSALTRFSLEDQRGKGIALVFNTPNSNSLPGYLKMGWRVVERWALYARPSRPLLAPWEFARSKILGTDGARPELPSWPDFVDRNRMRVETIVGIHERDRHSTGLRTPRDLTYLDWRYGGHPDLTYRVASSMSGGQLQGFIVGRRGRSPKGIDSFVITEIFAADPSQRGIRNVLHAALPTIPELYAVCHSSSGSNELRALRRSGFIRLARRGYTFTVLPIEPLSLDPTAAGSWDLTLGELEIF